MKTDHSDTERMPHPAAATRMRAMVHYRYGPPSVLQASEVPRPEPRRGEVLVRLEAASVHSGDLHVMAGDPYLVRLAFGLRRPKNPIPARDLAGVVAAVGADVTDLAPGDDVFGWSTTGTLAEYACVPVGNLVRRPTVVSAIEAAVTPMSGLTALQAMRDVARVQPGDRVLITGASGGVGSFAVQIAKAMGAEVTGVCSGRNVELVRSIGADHVIDYTTTDFTTTGERYDVILDSVEAQPLAAVRRALTPTGTVIPNSGRGGRWVGPLRRMISARMRSIFTRQRLAPFVSVEKHEDLVALSELLASGQVTPLIDRAYPLDEAADALRHVATGHARGKVAITI